MITGIEASKLAIKQGMPKLGVGFDYIIVVPRTDADVPQNGQDAYMPIVTITEYEVLAFVIF